MSPNCPSGTFAYPIVAGDTLFSLARRFNTPVQQIVALNNINPNNLQIGQSSHPRPGPLYGNTLYHSAGDTFFSLAMRYNIR